MTLSHGVRSLIYTVIALVAYCCMGQEIQYHGYVQAVLFSLFFLYSGYEAQVEWGLRVRNTSRRSFFYGHDGWPVELITGRPFTNLLRLLLHTDLRTTWRNWRHERRPSLSSEDETTRTFVIR